MQQNPVIFCDGCGQPASPEHIARRLKRLENMSRYRPIHVQALFLGAVSPCADGDYLYSAAGEFSGEGAELLRALGFDSSGRTVEARLAEFQRRGYLLAHVLDCAGEQGGTAFIKEALAGRTASTITRIRRSFKPKRVVPLGAEIAEFIQQLTCANLDATVLLNNGKPFEWNDIGDGELAKELAAPLQSV